MFNRSLFSSASVHWETPKALYNDLNKEFNRENDCIFNPLSNRY